HVPRACGATGFSPSASLFGGLKPAAPQERSSRRASFERTTASRQSDPPSAFVEKPVSVSARALLVSLLLLAPSLHAHEMGLTRVNATFTHDDAYRIDILVDPVTLLR